MDVQTLNHSKVDIAESIYEVMQASYTLEAKLLNIRDFPPLKKTAPQIQTDNGTYFGIYSKSELVGCLHMEKCNISSLVVSPAYHRRGLARELIKWVLSNTSASEITVSTAKGNLPANALYSNLGFRVFSQSVRSNIPLVHYAKQL